MDAVKIHPGIDLESQVSSFQNSTQHSVGAVSLSIATHVRVPEQVSAHGGRAIATFLVTELGAVVKKQPAISFEAQVELHDKWLAEQGRLEPRKVAALPGVSVMLGVSADDQRSSFGNATLQGGASAFSVATRVLVPSDVADRGESEIAEYVRGKLETAVKASPVLSFDVQIGPGDDAEVEATEADQKASFSPSPAL